MNSRTVSSNWLRGVIDVLANAGLDPVALMRLADIDPAILSDHSARVSTEKLSCLWREAVVLSDDSGIGLVGADTHLPGNFDVVGYAMLSSLNLYAALEAIGRYIHLVNDAAEIIVEHNGVSVRVLYNLFGGREPIPRQRIEFDLLAILNFCRWLAGRAVQPICTSIVFPPPDDAIRYSNAFGCPIEFSARFNGWTFSTADLATPLATSNPKVAKLHQDFLQQQVAIFNGLALSVKVRAEIGRQLANGEARRGSVANALNISERTLQRRLSEENQTFEKLLDATRCDLAQQYLARRDLSTTDVARLLSFGDLSTFFRACKRWFGTSPGQFRVSIRECSKKTPN